VLADNSEEDSGVRLTLTKLDGTSGLIDVLKLVIESTLDQESKEAPLGGEHTKKEI